MADDNKAVVDATKDQAKPDAAGADARKADDDLDALLAEFAPTTAGKSEAKPDTKTEPTKDQGSPVEGRVKALESQLSEYLFKQEAQPVITAIRGDIPADVFTDDEVVDWLDGQAKRNPGLQNAWANRHQNPKGFKKVVDVLARDFQKKFAKMPDRGATEDREMVAAAVRGASTKAPEGKAPNYAKLSNADFAKSIEDEYGFRPL